MTKPKAPLPTLSCASLRRQFPLWLVAGFLSLSACSPDQTAQGYLKSLQEGNLDKAYGYLSVTDRKYLKAEEFKAYIQDDLLVGKKGDERLLKQILAKAKFEVRKIETEGAEATVTYRSKLPDLSRIEPEDLAGQKKPPMTSRQNTLILVKEYFVLWRVFLNQERVKKLEHFEQLLASGQTEQAAGLATELERQYPGDAYIEEQLNTIRQLRAGQAYALKAVKVEGIKVSRSPALKDFVDISGRLRNTGKESLNRLHLAIEYLDKTQQPIYQETYRILDPEGFALASDNTPLAPGQQRPFKFGDSQVPLKRWHGPIRWRIVQAEIGAF